MSRYLLMAMGWLVGGGGTATAQPAQPVTELSFELYRNKILIPVDVNGTRLRFIFDTGSPPVVLTSPWRLAALGLESAGVARVGGAGSGAALQATVARGAVIQIGGIELPSTQVIALPIDTLLAGAGGRINDGIIGLTVLRRYVVDIDFHHRRLALYEPSSFRYQGSGTVVPLRLDGGHPHIRAKVGVNGEPVREVDFVVDTGAGTALAISRESAPDVPLPDSTIVDQIGFGVRGPVTGRIGRIRELRIGDLVISDVVATFPDPGMGVTPRAQGNLGADFLRRYRVIFDYPAGQMILEPRAPDEPFRWNATGVRLGLRNDLRDLVVIGVRDGSPAHEAGIAVGDRFLAIDDRSVEGLDLGAVMERLEDGGGQRRQVTIQRDGNRLQRILVLREPF